MTREQQFEQRLADWLGDGPLGAPDRVIDTAVAHARAHPRRRSLLGGLWRTVMDRIQPAPVIPPARRSRTRAFATVAVAAVVLLAIIGGGALLLNQRSVNQPAAVPTAAPTPASPTPATSAAPTGRTDAIKIGHLNYHGWPDLAASFSTSADFAIDIINEDPPLGRRLEVVDRDIMAPGEATAAKQLVEQDKVEVLLNVTGDYPSYRDWMLAQVKANRSPAMTTVLGGVVAPQFGGTVEEPLMRAVPWDMTEASAAVLYASDLGARRIAILADENTGLYMEQARVAARELGLEVVLTLNLAPLGTTPGANSGYSTEISEVAAASPDAVIMFSTGMEGGAFVKEAADAGKSWTMIGTSSWLAFSPTLPQAQAWEAIAKHKAVVFTGTTYANGPAWDYYRQRFDAFAATPEGRAAVAGHPADEWVILGYYDILNLTALAIEQAGTTATDKWLPAMRAVAMAPGTKCSSYAECLALIRAGTEVDYSGVTGELDYTETGLVSATWTINRWTSLLETERVTVLDSARVLELDQAGAEAGVGQ